MKLKERLMGLDSFDEVKICESDEASPCYAGNALEVLKEMSDCGDPRLSYPVLQELDDEDGCSSALII